VSAVKSKIRILLADDHAILRSGLKILLNSQPDMEVVGEAADGKQAIDVARQTKPDVALLDLTMPRVGGMQALQGLLRESAATRVLVLTMHDDVAYLRSVLAAGASGYVLKRSVDADLLQAIRAVHRGGTFIDPSLAEMLLLGVGVRKNGTSLRARPAALLSDRELQVLRLVARGYSSQEIAARIFVSPKTVETYRSRLAAKLGLKTRSDVIRYALQMGLLTPESVQTERAHPASS
jgi:DNA-binding NarL/FixJ family response regulator